MQQKRKSKEVSKSDDFNKICKGVKGSLNSYKLDTLSVQKDLSRNMTKPTVCAQRRLRSAWASAQFDQSLRCPPEESLDP